ncbi:hypothetical protein [Luteitalea sp.]|uniref:hypothetical protein n=1 Tax=Luteitalea sp. TaxID=2004800 RepID=UPI0025C55399|nr:hypothetical protein [Luteitalea sp.]
MALREIVACLALPVLASVEAAAQAQAPTFVARTEVLLLDVPVTDARGVPIRDLLPEDFVVEIGGGRQRVISAEVVETKAVAAKADDAVSSNEGPEERVVVIVTDLSADASEAQRSVSLLVKEVDAVGPDTRVGLASLSDGGGRLRPQVDRRQFRDALVRELQLGVSQPLPAGRQFDVSLSDAWRIVDGDQQRLREVEARVCAETGQRARCAQELETGLQTRVNLLRSRAEVVLARLASTMAELRYWPGRKDIVLVTDGWALDPREAASRVNELSRAAAAADVTIHVMLTTRRNTVSADTQIGASLAAGGDRALVQQPVQSLAAGTGGTLLPDHAGALAQVLQDSAVVYRLGIEGPVPDRQRQGHVRVNVRRSGARTGRHRQVLVPRATSASTTLTDALQQAIPASSIQLRVASVALFETGLGEQIRHVVSTHVHGARGATNLGWLIADDQGRVVTSRQATLDMAAVASRVVTTQLDLPPGRYQLRIGARDHAGALGTVIHPLDGASRPVGSLASARLAVLHAEPQVAPLLGPVAPGTQLVVRVDVTCPREPAETSLSLQRVGDADSSLILPALQPMGKDRWTLTATLPAPEQLGAYVVTAQVDGVTLEARFDVRP